MKMGQNSDNLATGTYRKTLLTMTSFLDESRSNESKWKLNVIRGLTRLLEMLSRKEGGTSAGSVVGNEILTGSMEFASPSSTQSREMGSVDTGKSSYKLIDLGTAVGVHELEDTAAADSMMTISEMAFAGYADLRIGILTRCVPLMLRLMVPFAGPRRMLLQRISAIQTLSPFLPTSGRLP